MGRFNLGSNATRWARPEQRLLGLAQSDVNALPDLVGKPGAVVGQQLLCLLAAFLVGLGVAFGFFDHAQPVGLPCQTP